MATTVKKCVALTEPARKQPELQSFLSAMLDVCEITYKDSLGAVKSEIVHELLLVSNQVSSASFDC